METIEINEYMHDRGRGPELKGHRITVYDLVPFWLSGKLTEGELLTDVFRSISAVQLAALKAYFESNREAVMSWHWKIEERNRIGQQESREMWLKIEGNTEGRVQYFTTWLRDRETRASNGGPPLPESKHELLGEYLSWWRHNRSGLNGVAK